LSGESSPAEARQVARWAQHSPRAEALLHQLQGRTPGEDDVSFDIDTEWAALNDNLEVINQTFVQSNKRSSRRRARVIGILAACTAVVSAVLIGTGRSPSHQPSERDSSALHYAAPLGRIANLTLPDGSRLTLSPGSHCTVASDFQHTRTVTLDGEALFDVVQAPNTPFQVRTRSTVTRVLGTTFDVRQFATDSSARIAVITGRVVSAARDTSVTLAAHNVATLTDSTATVIAEDDIARYRDWTTGSLAFDDAPVSEILATLSRWSGVRFDVADLSVDRIRLTARFDYRSSAHMIAALETLLDVSASVATKGDVTIVHLQPRRARTAAPGKPRTRDGASPTIQREVGR